MDELAHRYATAEVAFPSLYGRCSGSARSARVRQPLAFFERLLTGGAARLAGQGVLKSTRWLLLRNRASQAVYLGEVWRGEPTTADALSVTRELRAANKTVSSPHDC